MSGLSLPSSSSNQTYVTISPISGGFLTLPDSTFVNPADSNAKRYVPSLSFLVIHPGNNSTGHSFRLLFDLGLRHRVTNYSEPQQKHLESRSPYDSQPGVASILEKHGVSKEDIDMIIYSHIHYDHHGDPEDFSNAHFRVGSGSLDVLANGFLVGMGTHQHFDPNLLPTERTKEFPPVTDDHDGEWKSVGPFPHVFDLMEDGSIYVLDTPGHLPGHINLLCRIWEDKWVCLCGDAFHDLRLLSGEKEMGMWMSDEGRELCIHVDKNAAEESIKRLRELQNMGNVELSAAHDEVWCDKNQHRFFPHHL
ncbi:Metallo-hydrolase/oxidoreductase [Tothia fuscella]|uniref:Metallo-hydrolase/oxidoreductase n=1 Tax=Tothia fuscella TaxID=1048955 RepID=A0A9P4NM37_9PEZI|nr:Metallo-hydrolase/oxidoreductase [Tothia fuscella]